MIILKCTQCLKDISYGFYCRERGLFLCQECQDEFSMRTCPYDKQGEHLHFRVPGYAGQNIELKEEISKLEPK